MPCAPLGVTAVLPSRVTASHAGWLASALVTVSPCERYPLRTFFTGEESERSVRDLLGGIGSGEDPEERTEREEAAKGLQDLLEHAGGELPAKEVKAAAKSVGIVERTLDRAPRAGRCDQQARRLRQGRGLPVAAAMSAAWCAPSVSEKSESSGSASSRLTVRSVGSHTGT